MEKNEDIKLIKLINGVQMVGTIEGDGQNNFKLVTPLEISFKATDANGSLSVATSFRFTDYHNIEDYIIVEKSAVGYMYGIDDRLAATYKDMRSKIRASKSGIHLGTTLNESDKTNFKA